MTLGEIYWSDWSDTTTTTIPLWQTTTTRPLSSLNWTFIKDEITAAFEQREEDPELKVAEGL